MAYILNRITLDEVKAAKPETIFYGVMTPWWTHTPDHLGMLPPTGIPCDPRGGVLMQAEGDAFLKHVDDQRASVYGKYGHLAFMAAHHLNCVVSQDDLRSTCLDSWDEYNDAIEASLDMDLAVLTLCSVRGSLGVFSWKDIVDEVGGSQKELQYMLRLLLSKGELRLKEDIYEHAWEYVLTSSGRELLDGLCET